MPVQYTSILDEHRAVRTAVGLFDLSHMGELELRGPGAVDFLRYALVSDPAALEIGAAQYSMACEPDGGVIDDLIVYRLGPERFMVVCNASNRAAVAAHFAALLETRARRCDARGPERRDRPDRAAGPTRRRAARPPLGRRPRRPRELPRHRGRGGGHRVPGGPDGLHRGGRVRALLRRRARRRPVAGAHRAGRRPRPPPRRPRRPGHAASRGRHAALRQRARPRHEPVRGRTSGAS